MQEGRQEGLEEGRKTGLEEGRKEGREAGLEEGRQEGHQAGLAEGENRMLLLIQRMTEAGEAELISRLSERDFLEEMYRKYQV